MKPAAVRDAPENSRNKMRVVDQAESIECLIFLAEINVQPGVEESDDQIARLTTK